MIYALLFVSALAQTVDSHGIQFTPSQSDDANDPITTWEAANTTQPNIGAVLEYAYQPLTLHSLDDGVSNRMVLIQSITTLNVNGIIPLTDGVALFGQVPLYIDTLDGNGQHSAGFGDVRLGGALTFNPQHDLRFGVVPYLGIPGNYDAAPVSTNGFYGAFIGTTTWTNNTWKISGNAGVKFNPQTQFYNINSSDTVILGGAVGVDVSTYTGLNLEVRSEIPLERNTYKLTETPVELIGSVRMLPNDFMGLTAGLSAATTRGVGAAPWRAFVGIDFIASKRHQPCPETTCPEPIPEQQRSYRPGDVVLLSPINFDFDKSDIRPDAAAILDNVIKVMHDHHEIQLLEIATGTDERGTDAYNQALSERRAQSIMSYMIKHGIQSSRLTSTGFGEKQLIYPSCNNERCHEGNRYGKFSVLE